MVTRSTKRADSKSAFLRNTGLSLFVFTIAAFALKGIAHPERLARYTPLVIMHGIVMVGWLAFFTLQAQRIFNGNTRRHVASGKLSWILVLLMLCFSMPVSFSLMVEFEKTDVFIGNSFMFIAFLCFFAAAIYSIRKKDGDSHKRYMLFACLSVLLPAIGRVADVLTDNEALASLAVYFVLVIVLPLLYDRSEGGGIRRATIIGIAGSFGWVAVMLAAMASPLPRLLLDNFT